ncbi:MAG: zinc ribbon domain-containing protein [Thermoleophilia bacterium]|nr:zinc ribbon domain-containing protein [Thermoleophilia bacterium]
MSLTDIIDLGKNMGLILGLAFYVAIVIWTYKDARKRTEDPIMVATFTAIAMLPVFGVLIYMLVRPSEYIADVRERELEIRALERQLGRQERCPYCKSHIEGDYLSCPVCTTKLRQSCTGCDKPLDPRWVMCPFCETEVPGRGGRGPAGPGGGASRRGPVNTSSRSSQSEGSSSRERRDTSSSSSRETRSKDRSRSRDRDRSKDRDSEKVGTTSGSASAASATKDEGGEIRTEPFGAGDTTRI